LAACLVTSEPDPQVGLLDYEWVIEGDIKACFDTIDHRRLMSLVDRVREMIHRFNEVGMRSLDPQSAGGRPRQITTDDVEFIVETAKTRPEKLGQPFTRWSIRKLARYEGANEDRVVRIGRERLRQILEANGITFQRTKTWKEPNDPDRDAKLDRIVEVRNVYPDRCFAFDEFGPLNIRPVGGSCLGSPGQAAAGPGALLQHHHQNPATRQYPMSPNARHPSARSIHRESVLGRWTGQRCAHTRTAPGAGRWTYSDSQVIGRSYARGMSDTLELADYRRRVSDLYYDVRRGSDPEQAWAEWRERRDALFATHSQSPVPASDRPDFTGSPFFPYDPAWRAVAEVELVEQAPMLIDHSGGGSTRFVRFGIAHTAVNGEPVNADLCWLDTSGGGVFLPFRDPSNGNTTYSEGRYLLDTAKGADLGTEDGRLVLDFNFSYHPSCVWDGRWSCPLPPATNQLAIAVHAGERIR